MFTIILTAFSFLAAHLGWFYGAPQTEIFFWANVSLSILVGIIMLAYVLMESIRTPWMDGWVSLLTLFLLVVIPLFCLLIAWICTLLWPVDFFLAYQLMCVGSATASLFAGRDRD